MRIALLLSALAHGVLWYWGPTAAVVERAPWGHPLAVEMAEAPRPAVAGRPGRRRGTAAPARAPVTGTGEGSAGPREASLGELLGKGNAPPAYPEEALRREWEGTVRLRVAFDAAGGATDVDVLSSSGHRILDEAASGAAWAWRWSASAGGTEILVPVEFVLSDEG